MFFPSGIKSIVILTITSDLQRVFVRTPKQKFPFHPKSQTMSINFPLEHLSGRLRMIPLFFEKVPFFSFTHWWRPDQIYQQMIVAEQSSRAVPRGQKQRGETACSLFPCPFTHANSGPFPLTLNSWGHRWWFTTGPKSKGSDLTGPSGRCCVLTGWTSVFPCGPSPSVSGARYEGRVWLKTRSAWQVEVGMLISPSLHSSFYFTQVIY